MQPACRVAVAAVAFFAVVTALSGPLQAQTYPSKPIRMVLPFPPGGLSDALARTIGQGLTQAWGQQVVIDSRPGASTTLAAEIVARAPGDGYTLFFQDVTTHGSNAGLFRKLPYDTLKDFVPVAMASASPLVLSVHPSLPARSVKEFVDLARGRPGQISFGSSGNGAILHLAAEMFQKRAKVALLHVPYKGSPPAVTALLSGEVASVFATTGSVLPHVRSGRLRALGVTTEKRSELLPDLPAIAETVPGFDLLLYQGILAPGKTPPELVAKLNAEINRVMATPASRELWTKFGAEVVLLNPDEMNAKFRDEVEKLSKLALESGVRND